MYVCDLIYLISLSMSFFFLMIRRPPRSTPFPTRRSSDLRHRCGPASGPERARPGRPGRSTRRGSSSWLLRGYRLPPRQPRSEEHTSELQSRQYLVCRLLLEKKKQKNYTSQQTIQKTPS